MSNLLYIKMLKLRVEVISLCLIFFLIDYLLIMTEQQEYKQANRYILVFVVAFIDFHL